MSLGEEIVEDYVHLRLTLRAHPVALLRNKLTPGWNLGPDGSPNASATDPSPKGQAQDLSKRGYAYDAINRALKRTGGGPPSKPDGR